MTSYSFGTELKLEDIRLIEHYAYYDRPLSYLIQHNKTGAYYLVNLVDENQVNGQWVIEEVYTLLTKEQLNRLQSSQVSMRQLVMEGLKSETFMATIIGFGDNWTVKLSSIGEERLYRDILIDENILNFKAGE